MKDTSISKATGNTAAEWFSLIEKSNKGESSHKEIAEFLQNELKVTPWWAQEITVLYEKYIGRRVTGQTQNGLFQIGVSKTLPCRKQRIWNLLTSPIGLQILLGDPIDSDEINALEGKSPKGIAYKMTTFRPFSHLRLQWRLTDWPFPSILQIRVTEKSGDKTTLSIHQEKLCNRATRDTMKHYWQEKLAELQNQLKTQPSKSAGKITGGPQ